MCTEDSEIDIRNGKKTISAFQLEADGVVKNVRRDTSATQKGFDFLIDGVPSAKIRPKMGRFEC